MALASGDRLGPSEIQSALGARTVGQSVMMVPAQIDESSFAVTGVPRLLFPYSPQMGFPLALQPTDGRYLFLGRSEEMDHMVVGARRAREEALMGVR